MKKVLCVSLAIVICAVGSVVAAMSTTENVEYTAPLAAVNEIFADATRTAPDPDFEGFSLVYGKENNVLGRVVSSQPESDDVIGYAGKLGQLTQS